MNKLVLESDRVLIRNLKSSDLQDFHLYRSDPQVVKYQGFDVFTIEQAQDFIASQADNAFGIPGQWVQYGIEHNVTGQLIGDCAIKLQYDDNRQAEIGITISPQWQRQGYAKETLITILSFLFSRSNFHRVIETVDAENTASIQLLKSVGFRQEAFFSEHIFFKGKWGSEYQYAMLKKDWEALNQI